MMHAMLWANPSAPTHSYSERIYPCAWLCACDVSHTFVSSCWFIPIFLWFPKAVWWRDTAPTQVLWAMLRIGSWSECKSNRALTEIICWMMRGVGASGFPYLRIEKMVGFTKFPFHVFWSIWNSYSIHGNRHHFPMPVFENSRFRNFKVS